MRQAATARRSTRARRPLEAAATMLTYLAICSYPAGQAYLQPALAQAADKSGKGDSADNSNKGESADNSNKGDSADNRNQGNAAATAKDNPLATGSDSALRDASGDLTLSELRDSGLSLNQIRQQAINIYLEATRKHCANNSKFELTVPNAIADREIEGNAGKNVYMPPRAQWLVFYVGTIEPIISLFTQDVRDTKSGATKLLVPEDARKKLLPLWHEWQDGIDGINKELTGINNLIGDGQPENISLAKHAVAMYKYTQDLERTRRKAFAAIAASEKRKTEGNKVQLQ